MTLSVPAARRRALGPGVARVARVIFWNAVLAAAYWSVARVSLAAATEHRVVSSIWPPAGIALFALARYGLNLWPGVALGAYLLNASSGIPVLGSLLIAAGDALEAATGALLIRRVVPLRWSLVRVRDVAVLAGVAGAVSTLIGASIGVTTLVLTGSTSASTAFSLWLVWWTGDAVGVLVFAPLLFVWTTPETALTSFRWPGFEPVLSFAVTAFVTDVLFARWGMFVFAVYPLGTWLAWRYGPRGAATGAAMVTMIAAWRTLSGYGPFAALGPTAGLFGLQLFLALFAFKCLIFAAARSQSEAAQYEIEEKHEQLERLSRLLLTAQEDERRRVAREVHDELGQALTAVKLGLASAVQRMQRRTSLESERHVRIAADTLDRAIESVKRIVLQLRPGVLDNLGPVAALEYEVQQFQLRTNLAVSLDLPPEPLAIDAAGSTTLYRTVQEALTNVMRHAHAKRVDVSLVAHERELVLQVTDDGCGIADDQLRNPRSMGILGMRERAGACGGRLDLLRVPTGGTRLTLTIPRAAHARPGHMIRVLIADDHAVVRAGLRELLAHRGSLAVVGEAEDGDRVLALVGIDAGRRAAARRLDARPALPRRPARACAVAPRLKVLVLTMHPEDQFAARALRAGAAGYLTKDRTPDELLDAVTRLARGGRYISPRTRRTARASLVGDFRAAPHDRLSDRETRGAAAARRRQHREGSGRPRCASA